ncbi:MAG: hypothetical protein Q9190_000883 [Brigantiaea leucoxantha]
MSWSQDGELAVAAGESVYILIPQESLEENWTHVTFQVNTFTTLEWPMQDLAELAHFSLGAEQSVSTVIDLSWSLPGLAKHGDAALAVLTSNYVLSLWAPTSDPSVSAAWERVLIINNAIPAPPKTHLNNYHVYHRQRIRSISWSPSHLPQQEDKTAHGPIVSNLHSLGRQELHFLGITNEVEEVLIFCINSPHDRSQSQTWTATFIHEATWDQIQRKGQQVSDDPAPTLVYSLFTLSMDHVGIIGSISWGPWQKSGCEAPITFKRAGGISHCILRFASDMQSAEFVPLQSEQPLPSNLECQTDNSFSPNQDLALWFSNLYASSLNDKIEIQQWDSDFRLLDKTSYSLEKMGNADTLQFWDRVSGLAFGRDQSGQVHLYISKILSGLEILYFKGLSSEKQRTSTLQDQMKELHKAWDHRNDMGGMSVMKTWGVAVWDNYVASCISFHPGDMIEYTLANNERCVIVISELA